MNDHDFDLLSQYLDGELDTFTARRLEQRFAAEPELAATLAQLRAQQAGLEKAFEGHDAVPARVVGLLKTRDNVVPMQRQSAQRPAWHYALAASLVAGIGLMVAPPWQDSGNSPTTLATVLESSPSMAQGWAPLDDGSQVRPVLSFRNVDGNWCREYLATDGVVASRGVACRESGEWEVQVVAATDVPGGADQFRPAGAGDSDRIARYLEDHAKGIALSVDAEAALIEQRWQ